MIRAHPPRLPCSTAAVHSGNKESTMEQYTLTLGAHLLLWVFPLALVAIVLVEDFLDRRHAGSNR